MRRVTGILLAAGRGARFGGDKLLAALPDGTTLGVAAARAMMRVLPRVVAVVRPEDAALRRCLEDEWVDVVECAAAARGMGRSLACGIAAAPEAEAWLIALADMPYIKDSSYRRVAQALVGGAELAAPSHGGQRGHPVGFGAGFRAALLALDGDRGARDLFSAYAGQARLIEVDDPGVLQDVDTPQDLRPSVTS